ncbi:hypothetical protein M427DRAFT_498747 [Gonapodya prolifera JEL478]|uniref:Uncharacterized protein n=1 Tax=Gonapodya prolifera (strain JEL478) TaxID=1344416 RepID=A0A139AVH5_GONPJ|nr:hypothetical protein M427DRAFT_498747 [Gonapodya prolifera JEL478]|eukprot:KXS20717.1 hypothetical protein M427DRAFT_498747 [Gonapodya prolifera JEL478]
MGKRQGRKKGAGWRRADHVREVGSSLFPLAGLSSKSTIETLPETREEDNDTGLPETEVVFEESEVSYLSRSSACRIVVVNTTLNLSLEVGQEAQALQSATPGPLSPGQSSVDAQLEVFAPPSLPGLPPSGQPVQVRDMIASYQASTNLKPYARLLQECPSTSNKPSCKLDRHVHGAKSPEVRDLVRIQAEFDRVEPSWVRDVGTKIIRKASKKRKIRSLEDMFGCDKEKGTVVNGSSSHVHLSKPGDVMKADAEGK